jgi:hypothetical protein
VLDTFGGAGSTLIACGKHGRETRLFEIDPKYCDVIIGRWQQWGGEKAHNEEKQSCEEVSKTGWRRLPQRESSQHKRAGCSVAGTARRRARCLHINGSGVSRQLDPGREQSAATCSSSGLVKTPAAAHANTITNPSTNVRNLCHKNAVLLATDSGCEVSVRPDGTHDPEPAVLKFVLKGGDQGSDLPNRHPLLTAASPSSKMRNQTVAPNGQ